MAPCDFACAIMHDVPTGLTESVSVTCINSNKGVAHVFALGPLLGPPSPERGMPGQSFAEARQYLVYLDDTLQGSAAH